MQNNNRLGVRVDRYRSQITELLSEVRVNYDKTLVIQYLLRKLYEVIENVPSQEVLPPPPSFVQTIC